MAISMTDTSQTKMVETDETDNVVDINGKMGLDDFEQANYRNECSFDTSDDSDDSSSLSSLSVSSDDDEDQINQKSKDCAYAKTCTIKTRGELDINDLPKIEELNISVPESELQAIGMISGIVEQLLIVASFKNSPPLDVDSVLFLSKGQGIGKIFDVFGPVVQPLYAIRFNSAADINKKGLVKGETVYYAPENTDVTSYVFVDALRSVKGSDASWAHNNEPPVECLDYSDDEQEKQARQKRRAKTRSSDVTNNDVVPKKMPHINTESIRQVSPENSTISSQISNPLYRSFQNQPSSVTAPPSVQRMPQNFVHTFPPVGPPPGFTCRQNNPLPSQFTFPAPRTFPSPQFQAPTHVNPNFNHNAKTFHHPNVWHPQSRPNQCSQAMFSFPNSDPGNLKERISTNLTTNGPTVPQNIPDLSVTPATPPLSLSNHVSSFVGPAIAYSGHTNNATLFASNGQSQPNLRLPSTTALSVNWQPFQQPVFGMLPGSNHNQLNQFEGNHQRNTWVRMPLLNCSTSNVLQVSNPVIPSTVVPVNVIASRPVMPILQQNIPQLRPVTPELFQHNIPTRPLMPVQRPNMPQQQPNVPPMWLQNPVLRLPFYNPRVPPPANTAHSPGLDH